MSTVIACRTCGGSGHEQLEPHLDETYRLFDTFMAHLTARDVREALGHTKTHTVPAFNARLEALRKLGLLERSQLGNTYTYFKPTPPNDEPTIRGTDAADTRGTKSRPGRTTRTKPRKPSRAKA